MKTPPTGLLEERPESQQDRVQEGASTPVNLLVTTADVADAATNSATPDLIAGTIIFDGSHVPTRWVMVGLGNQ